MNNTYKLRPATPDDILAIIDLLRASDIKEFGEPNANTPEDVARWLKLAKMVMVAQHEQGDLAGYMELQVEGSGVIFGDGYVHPNHEGQGIGTTLLQAMEDEARRHIEEQPEGAQVIFQSGTNGLNSQAQDLFARHGYRLERTFHRMRIDMTEPPPAPQWPAGITVRPMVRDRDERVVFDTVRAAFQDHWGDVPRDYNKWLDRRVNSPHFDPDQWYLAQAGETIAGFSLCSLDELSGWVDTLGVRREWRRQGLALALLQYSFGEFWRRGVKRVSLGVDGTSLTGANRVYERGSMRVVQQYAVWAKVLRDGTDLRTTAV